MQKTNISLKKHHMYIYIYIYMYIYIHIYWVYHWLGKIQSPQYVYLQT